MDLAHFSPSVRRIFDESSQKWYFAIVDVVEILTNTPHPSRYWSDIKRKESELELYANIVKFPFKHPSNNRMYQTECANVEGILRIIQSIPSKKAEPLKLWLAQVGREKLEESKENALQAFRTKYKAKGYSPEWIDARIKNITARNELTDEWAERDVEAGRDIAILTAIIHKGAFDITIKEHKEIKGLKKENLRDNMTRLELALSTLAEEATIEIAQKSDAQGFRENQVAAQKGGNIAGNARKQIEAETGQPVVSEKKFLERKNNPKNLNN